MPETAHTSNVPNFPLWRGGENKMFLQNSEVEEDAVSSDLLNKLKENEDVRSVLRNPHLRAMMENLVNSDNPSLDMTKAMQEPIFTEFADNCLKVVDTDNKCIEAEAPFP